MAIIEKQVILVGNANFYEQTIEILNKIGGSIVPYERNLKYAILTLPEGFKIRYDDDTKNIDSINYEIIDSNDNYRGYVIFNKKNPIGSTIKFVTRFKTNVIRYGKNNEYYKACLSNIKTGEVIYEFNVPSKSSSGELSMLHRLNKICSSSKKCQSVARKLFPDIEDPLAYWDEDLEGLKKYAEECHVHNLAIFGAEYTEDAFDTLTKSLPLSDLIDIADDYVQSKNEVLKRTRINESTN